MHASLSTVPYNVGQKTHHNTCIHKPRPLVAYSRSRKSKVFLILFRRYYSIPLAGLYLQSLHKAKQSVFLASQQPLKPKSKTQRVFRISREIKIRSITQTSAGTIPVPGPVHTPCPSPSLDPEWIWPSMPNAMHNSWNVIPLPAWPGLDFVERRLMSAENRGSLFECYFGVKLNSAVRG